MPDIEIPCIQCKEIFLFTEKEQDTFYRNNMMPPQRCAKCRSKKAASAADAPKKFDIICDNCGKPDRVPFQPKVGRSILCRDCFNAGKSRHKSA